MIYVIYAFCSKDIHIDAVLFPKFVHQECGLHNFQFQDILKLTKSSILATLKN